jgi:APA family basic amino acid/polyamine antiporter
MSLFVRKPLAGLLAESQDSGGHTLKRTLGAWGLIALGIGAIIGAGLFSITGGAAANQAGPAITISFIVAALGCAFAGLCYAEFASMIPVAGSAYTYSYATMGEFIAWIIGWDLVLEYAVGAATVSISWSRYLVKFLEGFDVHLPASIAGGPWDGGIINLPAVFIVVLMSLLLVKGTQESAAVNAVIVGLKVTVVIIFIVLGWQYINNDNYTPYIPDNTGKFGEYGFSGIIRAAAIVFFAYIGFDAVSTAAQEAKNPRKHMPIGILGSLAICTVLYILFAHVMTGVTSYTSYKGQEGIAPVAVAIEHMGTPNAAGAISPDYPWLNRAIIVAILAGYASVILVMLMGQSRVFFSMSKDGLLPKVFSDVHPRFRTPSKSNMLFMIFVSLFAAFVPARVVGEMTSIGTLFAFILVCIGVIVMRRKMPEAPRAFVTPLVPLIPLLGVATCLFMMVFLPLDTWIRLIVWMIIGFDIYLWYGVRNSLLSSKLPKTLPQANRVMGWTGIGLSLMLALVAFLHHAGLEADIKTAIELQKTVPTTVIPTQDTGLFYFSMIFAAIHAVIYGSRLAKK